MNAASENTISMEQDGTEDFRFSAEFLPLDDDGPEAALPSFLETLYCVSPQTDRKIRTTRGPARRSVGAAALGLS